MKKASLSRRSLRAALEDATSADDVRAVWSTLLTAALAGDVHACQLYLSRALGSDWSIPADAPQVGNLDSREGVLAAVRAMLVDPDVAARDRVRLLEVAGRLVEPDAGDLTDLNDLRAEILRLYAGAVSNGADSDRLSGITDRDPAVRRWANALAEIPESDFEQ